MGLDRILLASVRRNLSFAERLAKESMDPVAKSTLEKFLARHILRPKVATPPEKNPAVVPTTEKERRIQRLDGFLPNLTDWDLANLLELAKSMYRFQVAGKQRKSKIPEVGQSGSETGVGPRDARAEMSGNG